MISSTIRIARLDLATAAGSRDMLSSTGAAIGCCFCMLVVTLLIVGVFGHG